MRSLFRPHYHVRSVVKISPAWVVGKGFRCLILDLDNTITGWHDTELPHDILDWLAQVRAAHIGLYVLTNSTNSMRAKIIAERLGCPVLIWAMKPMPRAFLRAARELGCKPGEVAAIGDQLRTDIVGGNLAGATTILVDRLTDREAFINAVIRRLEGWYLRRIGMGEPEELG